MQHGRDARCAVERSRVRDLPLRGCAGGGRVIHERAAEGTRTLSVRDDACCWCEMSLPNTRVALGQLRDAGEKQMQGRGQKGPVRTCSVDATRISFAW